MSTIVGALHRGSIRVLLVGLLPLVVAACGPGATERWALVFSSDAGNEDGAHGVDVYESDDGTVRFTDGSRLLEYSRRSGGLRLVVERSVTIDVADAEVPSLDAAELDALIALLPTILAFDASLGDDGSFVARDDSDLIFISLMWQVERWLQSSQARDRAARAQAEERSALAGREAARRACEDQRQASALELTRSYQRLAAEQTRAECLLETRTSGECDVGARWSIARVGEWNAANTKVCALGTVRGTWREPTRIERELRASTLRDLENRTRPPIDARGEGLN